MWSSPTAPIARRRARRAARRGAAARPDARLLLGQRVDGRRSGDEDGEPVLEQPGAAAPHLHHAAPRLSRRHGRRDVGERRLAVHAAVRPDAVRRRSRARAVLLPLSAGSRASELPDRLSRTEVSPIVPSPNRGRNARCAAGAPHRDVAAVLVEPMLQGAGGMIVWPARIPGRRAPTVRRARRAA